MPALAPLASSHDDDIPGEAAIRPFPRAPHSPSARRR